MAKNESDLPTRLREAAIEMFRERGYDRTTAAEIAARAGVTERTFFRYFADKREVLFDGEPRVRTALTGAIFEAPAELGPIKVLLDAFRAFEPMLENSWSYSKPRQELIHSTPALHEREISKLDALTKALAEALRLRGVPDLRAALAAQTGMAAFTQAATSWLNDPEISYRERIEEAFSELAALFDRVD